MPDDNLRAQSIEYFLKRVQGLASVADKDQVQSIMAVLARCTIELADQAKQLSEDINHAKTILGTRLSDLTAQIKAASDRASADINTAKEAFLPALAELISELKQTRLIISEASSAASQGTSALVKWTKTLVFVTIVYAAATLGMLLVMISRSTPH
jgi:ABC-type transporter Mla subunit MlaD